MYNEMLWIVSRSAAYNVFRNVIYYSRSHFFSILKIRDTPWLPHFMTVRYNMLIWKLWNSSYRQTFLGAMDITSIHRCSVPEFDFRRDIYFHEYMKYYNIKVFPGNLFFLSFSSWTLSLNKFRFYIQIFFQMCRGL